MQSPSPVSIATVRCRFVADAMIELIEGMFYLIEAILSWRFTLTVVLTGSLIWWVIVTVPQTNLQLAICVPLGIIGFVLGLLWENKAHKKG